MGGLGVLGYLLALHGPASIPGAVVTRTYRRQWWARPCAPTVDAS